MTTGRAACAWCGKAYGQRNTTTEQVTWLVGEQRPPYQGNQVVIKEKEGYRTADGFVARRILWDGVSYFGGYKPFCTLRCALEFARAAYKKGVR